MASLQVFVEPFEISLKRLKKEFWLANAVSASWKSGRELLTIRWPQNPPECNHLLRFVR